jgi:transcriptional regulator with XRE-family HTH domain
METLTTPEVRIPRARPRPNRLREFRLRADITQLALAEAVGTTQSCIAEAERSGKGLGEAKWQKLAEILGSDVLTLRGWKKIYAETS